MPYVATDPKTWNRHERTSGRQVRPLPDRAWGYTKMAASVAPGDAVWDAGFEAWRGVTEVAVVRGKVELQMEDGGRLVQVSPERRFDVSETGLRGWTNAAAASAAWKRGQGRS